MATAKTADTTEPKAKKDPKAPKCNTSKVKVGSVYSRHSFGSVKSIGMGNAMIENENGDSWQISMELLEKEFSFADQAEEEKTVSRTEAIEALTAHPFMAMTVNFNKQPKAEDVATNLKGGQGAMSDKDWKKHVEKFMEGEERTMIGHHFGTFDEHRRLQFISSGEGPRLVDPRTINWLIVDRIKYIVK